MKPTEYTACTEAHAELAKIQQQMRVPKDQFNQHGKYNFRNAESIMRAVKPFLPEGSTITMSDDMFELSGRFYLRTSAEFFFKGFTITKYGVAREQENQKGMNEAQITCSTSSYARKYALCALLLIDDGTLDPDVNNKHDEEEWKREQFANAQRGFAKARTIEIATAMAAERKERAKAEGWIDELLAAFTERKTALAGSGVPAAAPPGRESSATPGSENNVEPDPACPMCMVMLNPDGTCPDCGHDRAMTGGQS